MSGRILLLENIHTDAKTQLEAQGFAVDLRAKALPETDLLVDVPGHVALGIRSKTQITKKVIEAARPSVRAIGAFCIGTNQVALDAANENGIPVFNAPFSNTRSVAELILAEIVVLSRRLGDRVREMHRGVWTKSAAGSHEVRGKTLGIVGYGHIGRQIGVLAEMMGMHVVFYDVAARLPMGNNRSADRLETLLAESDFVTLHVPETPQTKDMIGAAELACMKPGACLLNASRGSVVVISALAEVLRSGHVAGAAIDVFPVEPEGNDGVFASELQDLPNVILTPHIGGSTSEAQVAIGHEVSAALIKFLELGTTTGAVNFPQAEMPRRDGVHRIAHVHKNVPGVLRDVNRIVSDAEANVVAQVLATDAQIGYLLMDVEDEDQRVTSAVVDRMHALDTTISARFLLTAMDVRAARLTERPLALLSRAAGSRAEMAAKLVRLARALGRYADRSALDDRLARLHALGHVDVEPTRLQLVVGSIDMLRFWISPAAAEYYEERGIHFGFHQILRILEEPASMVDPTGLLTERDVVIDHLLQVVHANPAYDLQLLEVHEDGLAALEAQTEAVIAGTHPKARSLAATVEDPDYHARLLGFVRAFRLDPQALAPVRSNVAGSPRWEAIERTFGTLPAASRYFARMPESALGAARHLLTVRQFPRALAEPPPPTPIRE